MSTVSMIHQDVLDRSQPGHARDDSSREVLLQCHKSVLLCGHRAYAATGLERQLLDAGYRVYGFSRGPVEKKANTVSGPVLEIDSNPYLPQRVHTVINYIFLQDESVEDNLAYVEALLKFCESRDVKHLIHISSCSAYKNSARHIDEDAPIETDPRNKGPYAAIKSATESLVAERKPRDLKVSHLRPGLILGDRIRGYIGGIGIRLPWNAIVGVGNANSQLPLVTRECLNRTILRLLEDPPATDTECLLLADSNSPTRREYVRSCCGAVGSGARVHFFPTWLWLSAAFFAEIGTRLVGKGHLNILSKVRSVCRYQRFDASQTEARTGLSFTRDWPQEVRHALDDQQQNYQRPEAASLVPTDAKSVTFIGFGRIVKTRHLPALQRLRFAGDVRAYDLSEGIDQDTKTKIECIHKAEMEPSGLYVVATPGPAHHEALEVLRRSEGPVLVEKPLCYNVDELERWLEFSRARKHPVMVCHNSLYRANVAKMFEFMARYNPGKLHHVDVTFQSPPVINDTSATWLRDERRVRTLLLDYGVHSMHVGCMLGEGEPELQLCRHEISARGHTSLIQGSATFANYSMNFFLRQGFIPRKMEVVFRFQNYTARLGFSPDTFVAEMSNDNFGIPWLQTRAALVATVRKVWGRIRGVDNDDSHARVLSAALQSDTTVPLTVERLAPTYRLLLQISRSVYGD